MRCSKSSSKREVYSNTILPQETREISNKQIHLTSKAITERRTTTTTTKNKVSRRKEIIKIRAEISEIEMNKTITKNNKNESWVFEKIKLINL